jgi:hypothetical protein
MSPFRRIGKRPLPTLSALSRHFVFILPQWLTLPQAKWTENLPGIALGLCKRFILPIAVALACAIGTCAQRDREAANPTWKLRGSALQLRLRSDGLVVETRPIRFFEVSKAGTEWDQSAELHSRPDFIPLSAITAVIREVVTRMPVQTAIDETLKDMEPENMIKMTEGADEGAIGLPAMPLILAVTAGAMVPFRGVKTHICSVRILWLENRVPRSTNFVLSARDSESLSGRLAQIVGRVRVEVYFDKEAHDEQMSQIVLRFMQRVSIGTYTSWGGTYRLLLLKCSDGTNLVYFFAADKQMPQDALLTVTADSSPLGSEKPWRVKLARDLEGSFCFTEIDTDTERLLVRTCQAEVN